MLAITLPHVQRWNTWWEDYGNSPEGFAALDARIGEAARAAGRHPASIDRSACVLVRMDPASRGRPPLDHAPAVPGDPDTLAAHLRALAAAGADEAILVLDPITRASVEALAPALAALDS
jgi:alkanesulfonate monooxygenase SsuD/methylene tetrahydromethanopterin reductase-like flavin-dependent oxidoreductase (luciferase family)